MKYCFLILVLLSITVLSCSSLKSIDKDYVIDTEEELKSLSNKDSLFILFNPKGQKNYKKEYYERTAHNKLIKFTEFYFGETKDKVSFVHGKKQQQKYVRNNKIEILNLPQAEEITINNINFLTSKRNIIIDLVSLTNAIDKVDFAYLVKYKDLYIIEPKGDIYKVYGVGLSATNDYQRE